MADVQHWLAAGNVAGETPIWVAEENGFYWTDCVGRGIYRAHLGAGSVETFTPAETVTALARRASGGWIVLTNSGPAFWDGRSGALEPVANAVADRPDHRCNDGAVDRAGRLWLGTMHAQNLNEPTGSLWRLDADLSLHEMATGFAVPNGIAFSPDDTTLYLTDMFHSRIVAYDFDLAAGTIANPRDFAVVPADAGVPDGLIVDAEGCLWSAHWGGWRVTRYAPDGAIVSELRLPVANVTCMGFGGPERRDLLITTASAFLSEEELAAQPLAGDVFLATPGPAGLPEPEFAG